MQSKFGYSLAHNIANMSQSGLSKKGGSKLPPFKGSPQKKLSSKLTKTVSHVVTVFAPLDDSPLEVYAYDRQSKNGRVEGYTKALRDFIDETDIDIPLLSQAGFTAYFHQRRSSNDNSVRAGADDWARYFFIRMVPENVMSSENTRQEGLNVLESFLKDRAYSRYPPSVIMKIDTTDNLAENNGRKVALDHYFLDRDVLGIMSLLFEQDLLNNRFYSDFRESADQFFTGPVYCRIAVQELGYLSTSGEVVTNSEGHSVAISRGFVLPNRESPNRTGSYGASAVSHLPEQQNSESRDVNSENGTNGNVLVDTDNEEEENEFVDNEAEQIGENVQPSSPRTRSTRSRKS